MTPAEQAIREALDAGPTPGPWTIEETATHVTVRNADGDAIFHDAKRIQNVVEDARLIVACNPPNIAALLGELDRLRAAVTALAERVQKYRVVMAMAASDQGSIKITSDSLRAEIAWLDAALKLADEAMGNEERAA